MSTLELRQRGLLDLVKNRGVVPADPYLQRVANSRELAMVRKIARWWRALSLEAQCRFTTRLLKRTGRLDAAVEDFFRENATSPFIEEVSLQFLASLRDHRDGLVRAMAQFELALLKARVGSTEPYEVVWDRNPDLVVVALETGGELPAREPDCRYRMRIGRNLPGMVACSREAAAPSRRTGNSAATASCRATDT